MKKKISVLTLILFILTSPISNAQTALKENISFDKDTYINSKEVNKEEKQIEFQDINPDFYDFEKFLQIIFSDYKKREELSQNARDYALENFSIDSFGKKCEKIYKKALEKEIIDENSYI